MEIYLNFNFPYDAGENADIEVAVPSMKAPLKKRWSCVMEVFRSRPTKDPKF